MYTADYVKVWLSQIVAESIVTKSILWETNPSLLFCEHPVFENLVPLKWTTGIGKASLGLRVAFLLRPKAEAVNLLYDKVYDLRLPVVKGAPRQITCK